MTLVVEILEFSTFSTIYAITFVCVYELKLSNLINTYESFSGGIYNVGALWASKRLCVNNTCKENCKLLKRS